MYRARASRSQSGSAQKTCVPSGRATMKIASLSAGRAAAAIASGPGFPIGVEGRPTRTFVSTDSDRTVGGRRVSPCESIGRARRVTERRASREPIVQDGGYCRHSSSTKPEFGRATRCEERVEREPVSRCIVEHVCGNDVAMPRNERAEHAARQSPRKR